jgi:hypothetical protein
VHVFTLRPYDDVWERKDSNIRKNEKLVVAISGNEESIWEFMEGSGSALA